MNEINFNQQPSFGRFPLEGGPRPSFRKKLFLIIGLILLAAVLGFIFLKFGFTLGKIIVFRSSGDYRELMKGNAIKDPSRINILLLGQRGENDPYGGLLTDTIMILSIKKDTRQIGLISVPRDIYLEMPKTNRKERINFAYALGYEKGGEKTGILYAQAAVSEVTGLYFDHAIVVDFIAFKEVVDALGGIIVYLDRPFVESSQFAQEKMINLPAGKNFLDGQTALYLARARFSTSDFDRARRQQEILLAIKEKAFSLGILTNPVKVFNLSNTLGKHIKTDMTLDEITSLINLYSRLDFNRVKKRVFDTSPEGLLYSSQNEIGAYILLPNGDNFDKIQAVSKRIFD